MALILSSALGFSPTTHVRTVHSAAVSRPAAAFSLITQRGLGAGFCSWLRVEKQHSLKL